jgi:non-homologous end joining protein Ku
MTTGQLVHQTEGDRSMASNVAWKGAIEVAGHPANLALYSRVRKQRNESFRNIAPSGQPVQQQVVDPATGKVFTDDVRKGVKTGGTTKEPIFTILTPEALEQINSGVKTEVATPAQFSPVDSIAWDLAIDRFAVRPDDGVAGSAQSVNVIWNGLLASGLAYVTQVSLTGGHDAILAIYATDNGLWAALLPFESELYDVPTHAFEKNEKAGALFGQALDTLYPEKVGAFDHSAYVSEYKTRRQAAIDAVIAGETVDVTMSEPVADETPDLMAILAAAAKPAAPAKKAATKKAKVAA